MFFNFNLHNTVIAIKIETANFQLITNWHLVIPSQSRDVCTYILYYIFIYINTIVKSFCSFPLFFFPPLPCLLFPNCSSSDKYCFVFIFIFIYIQMELKHSACLRLWLTMKRAHCSNRPSLCPLFRLLSGHSVSLALSTSTCVSRYTKTLHTSAWNRHQAFTLFPHSVADKIDVEMIYEYCFQLSHFLFYNFGF